MFEIANPRLARRFAMRVILALALGAAAACAAVGGLAWYSARCSYLDYVDRASTSPRQPGQRYLFACGGVWQSAEGAGQWTRLETQGLPFGARDGYIAVDLKPGFLYVGLVLASHSSLTCWDCGWSQVSPAVYVSIDGGHTWTVAHQFESGPAEDVSMVGVFADPEQDLDAWAVLLYDEEIIYYNSKDGRRWSLKCNDPQLDMLASRCELPDRFNVFDGDAVDGDTVDPHR